MSTFSDLLDAKVAHQPEWCSAQQLAVVMQDLSERPPLVDAMSCHALISELELVARGEAFVIQAGECAELFSDSSRARIQSKAAQLHQLCEIVESAGLPTVRIGRFAGQYAKPRSCRTEILADGTVLPVYRGDAVNGRESTPSARLADPMRMLTAYDRAAIGLEALFMRQLLLSAGNDRISSALAPTYVSHEALLLDFERAMMRPDQVVGGRYASSAHSVWIGERTRQLDHAHLAFAVEVNNAVGVKLGPDADPNDVITIFDRLAAGRRLGRLSLIVRMGVAKIAQRLPCLVAALGERARKVIWLSDPMHGNTTRTATGRKTRVVGDVLAEIEQFCGILRRHGCWPGGLHLEVTPDSVTECVTTREELASTPSLDCFESACDPRLDAAQAAQAVRHVVGQL